MADSGLPPVIELLGDTIPPRLFFLADVLETLEVTPKGLLPNMSAGLHVPILVPAPAPLGLRALATQYGTKAGAATFTVPAHRFGAAQLAAALSAVRALMRCSPGWSPRSPSSSRSAITVALYTAGSAEYMAFWGDLGSDCMFTYLGTQQISVHNIATIPPEG